MGVGLLLGAAGTIISGVGTIVSANQQAAAAEAQADEAERQASEQRAVSQREAIEVDRRQRLQLSSLQARAAASGGSASDPTVTQLAQGIAGQGAYAAASAVYEGESRGRTLEAQAAEYRRQARASRAGGYLGAASTIISGASSFARYRPPSGSF